MHDEFARPGFARVAGAEVHERHGKQREAHGSDDAGAAGLVPYVAVARRTHRGGARQHQETGGDQHQGGLVERLAIPFDLPEGHANGDGAQQIPGADKRRPAIFHRHVQQHSRQETEHRKADGHYEAQHSRRQSGPGQHHQRAGIPDQREGGKPSRIDALAARTSCDRYRGGTKR